MLIAMAGLPATGKSSIARRLAAELPGILLNKDHVRAALFPPAEIEYSQAQDDLCVQVIYQVTAYLLRKNPTKYVIIDGRTFLKHYQVTGLVEFAASVPTPLKVIECVCTDEVARQRLEWDAARQMHPASNRTFELYCALKASAMPLDLPRLVLTTDAGDLDAYVHQALDYITERNIVND